MSMKAVVECSFGAQAGYAIFLASHASSTSIKVRQEYAQRVDYRLSALLHFAVMRQNSHLSGISICFLASVGKSIPNTMRSKLAI